MTRTDVHYEVEVLYDTTFTTACGSRSAKRVTKADHQVTCRKCLSALGYEVPSPVVPFTRMSIDLTPDGGRIAA